METMETGLNPQLLYKKLWKEYVDNLIRCKSVIDKLIRTISCQKYLRTGVYDAT